MEEGKNEGRQRWAVKGRRPRKRLYSRLTTRICGKGATRESQLEETHDLRFEETSESQVEETRKSRLEKGGELRVEEMCESRVEETPDLRVEETSKENGPLASH